MTAKGAFRNVNILHEFNSSNPGMTELYTPGFLAPYDIESGLKYSAFITSLRLTIDITSIPELAVVTSDLLASDDTIIDNTKETFKGNAKKAITFYLKTSITPLIKIADIFLFNQRPYYYIDLIDYFTSAATFDMAPDAVIAAQQTDVGYGFLQATDRVLLIGSAVEEAPKYEPAAIIQNITNNYSSGNNPILEEVDEVPFPEEVRTLAGDNDYVFMLANDGTAYKILKTDLFSEIIDLIPQTPPSPPTLSGSSVCQEECSIGGKAFQSDTTQTVSLKITVKPGLNISYGTDSIQVHRWSQEPNPESEGRVFLTAMSSFGSEINITLDDAYPYFSISARNGDMSNFYDTCCFTVNGNNVEIVGFY